MGLQASTAVRNGMLDAIETAMGQSAKLEIFTGSVPASCGATESGTKLVEFDLAASGDWAAASAAAKALNSLPLTATAAAGGTAGHFRFLDSAGTTCHLQGTVTATGGGGDMTVDNTNIASGQTVKVTGFTINASMA